MKKTLIHLYACSFFMISFCGLWGQNSNPEYSIQNAFLQDKKEATSTQLKAVLLLLETVFELKDTPFNRYWLSYALYHQALLADVQNQKKIAEVSIDRSIALLMPLENDAESLALLSIQQGYSTQFKWYLSMMQIGRQALQNATRAVELNPNSLRTHLALSINDFYTPKVFGGGALAPIHLKKALEVVHNDPTDRFPSWGKDQVYELLVKHFRKQDQDSLAQDYLERGLIEFPTSELLQELN